MWKLLVLEWSKFNRSPVIRLLIIFFLILFPGVIYIANQIAGSISLLQGKDLMYQFPRIWTYLGSTGNWMVFFFLGVLAIYTVANEVTYKTMRQSIINGMTRQSYFLSKVLTIVSLSLMATLYYTLTATILGVIGTEELELSMIMDNELAVLRFFIMSLSYLSFAFFIGILLKRSGIAVFSYLTFVLIVGLLIRALLEHVFGFPYNAYLPIQATSDLMPNPLWPPTEALTNFNNTQQFEGNQLGVLLALVSGYCLMWLGLSYYIFMKRDL
jgi:ABC-type transport system involved in multi-copper enzyme maturation permease subunit